MLILLMSLLSLCTNDGKHWAMLSILKENISDSNKYSGLPGGRIIDNGQFRPWLVGTQSDWFRLCSQVKTWEYSQLCSSEHPIILCSQELRSERFQVWSWEHSELKTWEHWGFFLQGRKSGGFCFQTRKSCGNKPNHDFNRLPSGSCLTMTLTQAKPWL